MEYQYRRSLLNLVPIHDKARFLLRRQTVRNRLLQIGHLRAARKKDARFAEGRLLTVAYR